MPSFALEFVCLGANFVLRLKKTKRIFWGNFKNTSKSASHHQKSASHASLYAVEVNLFWFCVVWFLIYFYFQLFSFDKGKD